MTITPLETMRLLVTGSLGVVLGFFIGISSPKLGITSNLVPSLDLSFIQNSSAAISAQNLWPYAWNSVFSQNENGTNEVGNYTDTAKIWTPTNPRGAERLPPKILKSESDFYLRRLWGDPNEDLMTMPKYLVTFTVGYSMKQNIDAVVKKFSDDFTILLFHYDGRTSEWDEFEWSKTAIHISAKKQTKWWYAKRFLHPDIVAAYDYIFIWDEDLGVEHFNATEYIRLMRKHGLEISQPGLESNKTLAWKMTKKMDDSEVHKNVEERPGRCHSPNLPPCAAFVEIMAPVFSREAWRCVWHMLQNDLVHGWGLDLAFGRCMEPAHEKIGVVDAQWIIHQSVPSLGDQGQASDGKTSWQRVRERCDKERGMFKSRMINAERHYYREQGIQPPNATAIFQ